MIKIGHLTFRYKDRGEGVMRYAEYNYCNMCTIRI